MATGTIDIDLPPGVTLTGYQRYGDGHGREVAWPLPPRCRCDRCGRDEKASVALKDGVQVVRDRDICGPPSSWTYQPAYHRCPWCHHRQGLIPPFKRKDTSSTYRFEQHALRLLIGSNEGEVARRLALSAAMVGLIVRHPRADAQAKEVDPPRRITDVGLDELSLKKRPQLYATILTDRTDPQRPEVLAVAEGRDEAAARQGAGKLGDEQRPGVQAYRAGGAGASTG